MNDERQLPAVNSCIEDMCRKVMDDLVRNVVLGITPTPPPSWAESRQPDTDTWGGGAQDWLGVLQYRPRWEEGTTMEWEEHSPEWLVKRAVCSFQKGSNLSLHGRAVKRITGVLDLIRVDQEGLRAFDLRTEFLTNHPLIGRAWLYVW